jgi:ubiquitin-protein ligase
MRRLRNDRAALDRLRSESTVFNFSAHGDLPQHYQILLKGKSLWRDRGRIRTLDAHRIEIKLGSSYPRTIPEIRWLSPIYHPNISEIGMVCLGGYGTHWVPSIQLDELCIMLWDMARYHNYDIRSPYNRDAALWVASQTKYLFPMDQRPLRDKRAAEGRGDSDRAPESTGPKPAPTPGGNGLAKTLAQAGAEAPSRVLQFISRYREMLTSSAEPIPNGHRAMDETAEYDTIVGPVSDQRPATAPDSAIQPAHADIDEVVLLESVTGLGPAGEAATPMNDEIIFLE